LRVKVEKRPPTCVRNLSSLFMLY